jgi:hypothetical protein
MHLGGAHRLGEQDIHASAKQALWSSLKALAAVLDIAAGYPWRSRHRWRSSRTGRGTVVDRRMVEILADIVLVADDRLDPAQFLFRIHRLQRLQVIAIVVGAACAPGNG